MKKRLVLLSALGVVGALLSFASSASASEPAELLGPRHRKFESPQRFAFELRFSPYSPNIDSDPQLHGTPYQDVFGTMPRLLIAAELDWQVLRIPYLGTLGPGAMIGYTAMSARAKLAQARASQVYSDEDTSLEIFPMDLVAVLRADTFWRDARIPLIPYAKLGVATAFWRAYNETGTSSSNGVLGKGHTNGFTWALGLMFSLNILDPYAARNFDNELGVNNTAIYAELYSLNLTGLGQSGDTMHVGQTDWSFGMTWEF